MKKVEQQKLRNSVNSFAIGMKAKLLSKLDEGYHGWDDPKCYKIILVKLLMNFADKDWIDVANLAMMLHKLEKRKAGDINDSK